MNIPGLGTTDYPTTGYTNNNVLFSSLGTFWTKIFQDRGAIAGLTIGQSEELLQRYYDTAEALQSLSAKEAPSFHRERWIPIKLRKSELRLVPLKFLPSDDPNHAVFGVQLLPTDNTETNNLLHYGETFQFGYAKRPIENRYSAKLDPTIVRLPILTDRIIGPSNTLVHGIDYWLKDGELYFIKNPFDNPAFLRYELFADDGTQLTFTWKREVYPYTTGVDGESASSFGPEDGTVVNEEELVLWACHAEVNTNALYKNFGVLAPVNEEDAVRYKQIVERTVNLLTEGPSIQAVTSMFASFTGVELVRNELEVLVDAYTIGTTKFVVTDQHVYTADSFYNFSPAVINESAQIKVGAKLTAGTPVFDAVLYFDRMSSSQWWRTQLSRIILPGSMFLGDYQGMLVFEDVASFQGDPNKLRYSPDITNTVPDALVFPFPPSVLQSDQDIFNAYISDPARYFTVRALIEESSNAHMGNLDPLDFIFQYFLQTNTVLFKLRFKTMAQVAKFAAYYHLIKNCLPKYVYLLIDFTIELPSETAIFAKNTTTSTEISSDGSDVDGWVSVPPSATPPWQTSFGWPEDVEDTIRPFSISHLLNLVETETVGDTEFYQHTLGVSGDPDIPLDLLDLAAYDDGHDVANLTNVYPLTGQITIVHEGLSVTGTGTKFLSELSVGDLLYTADTQEYRRIDIINSDTSLHISEAFSGATRTIPVKIAHEMPSTRNIAGLILWSL